jgi:hypothetical protein
MFGQSKIVFNKRVVNTQKHPEKTIKERMYGSYTYLESLLQNNVLNNYPSMPLGLAGLQE